MIVELDYKSFCDSYYDAAMQVADITIAEYVKKHGQFAPFIDVDLVKDLGVSYGLEKVYGSYDVDHESNAGVKTFLSRVVRNCVLTELGKESTAVGAKKRNKSSIDIMPDTGMLMGHNNPVGSGDYMGAEQKSQKKEELIAQMLKCLKKQSGVDQIILSCWMTYPQREYTDRAIEELSWENNKRNRNVVNVRCNRSIEMTRKMMERARSDYNDIVVTLEEKMERPSIGPKVHANIDYNFVRRRRRAAKKNITGSIDYDSLAKVLASRL